MSLHPDLEAAMNRNQRWIMFKCRDREENKFLCEELFVRDPLLTATS